MQIDELEGGCGSLGRRWDGGSGKKSCLRAGVCLTPHASTSGFLHGSVVKNLPAIAGGAGSIPESGRSPGGGNGNQLQYSCQENPKDKAAWWATVRRGHKESDTTEHTHTTFMTKPLNLGIEGHFFKLIKGIYKTLTTNTINDKGLNAFPLQSRLRQGCPL